MILTIFNKFLRDKKGAVELIESAIVFPIMLMFIALLFILSFLLIRNSIALESVYANSRSILNKTEEDFSLVKNLDKEYIKNIEIKQNEKLLRLGNF